MDQEENNEVSIDDCLNVINERNKSAQSIRTYSETEILKWIEYNEEEIDIRFESIYIEINRQEDRMKKKVDRFLKGQLKLLDDLKNFKFQFNHVLFDTKRYVRLIRRFNKTSFDDISCVAPLKAIESYQMGYFKYYCKYSKMKYSKTVDSPVVDILGMAFINSKKQIILTKENSLHFFNENCDYLAQVRLMQIDAPTCLCLSSLEQSVISSNLGITLVDRFYRPIKVLDDTRGAHSLVFDNSNPNILYAVFQKTDKVKVYDLQTLKKLNVIPISKPLEVVASRGKIFIISLTKYSVDDDDVQKLKEIKGPNCIHLISKSDHKQVGSIKFDFWLLPQGLHVDENESVWTFAFKIDKKNKLISEYRCLFIINKFGDLIKEIQLFDIAYFRNVCFLNTKFIFTDAYCNSEMSLKRSFKIIKIK